MPRQWSLVDFVLVLLGGFLGAAVFVTFSLTFGDSDLLLGHRAGRPVPGSSSGVLAAHPQEARPRRRLLDRSWRHPGMSPWDCSFSSLLPCSSFPSRRSSCPKGIRPSKSSKPYPPWSQVLHR